MELSSLVSPVCFHSVTDLNGKVPLGLAMVGGLARLAGDWECHLGVRDAGNRLVWKM